jgi:FkbM family methyltransferase
MKQPSNTKLLAGILYKSPIWSAMVRPQNILKFLFVANAYLMSQALGRQNCIDHFNLKLKSLYGQKINKSMLSFRIPGFGRLVFPSESGWIVVEIFVFRVYERFFEPSADSTLIDIGAHAGSFTVKMAKKVQRVVAIEPNPRTFKFLTQNLGLNRLKNVDAINIALSDNEGTANLLLGDASHLSTIMHQGTGGVKVKTETLDGIVEKFGLNHIDFVKLDAEGAELVILQGGLKTLQLNKPNIAMEVHSPSEAKNVSEILRSIGYETILFHDILYASQKPVSPRS